MHIRRLIYGKYSPYVISVILGVGLSCMFRRVCKERNCLVYKAPSLDKIEGKIYQYNNKCYNFTHAAQTCNPNKKIVQFA
jgi:hypothetical protein